MTRNSEQIAIAEAIAIKNSLEDSALSDEELQLIVKLAWAARRRSTDERENCLNHINFIITEAARRTRSEAEDSAL